MPYHKSVLDWLGSREHAGEELYVEASVGHAQAARGCCALASSLAAAPPGAAGPSPLPQYVLLYAVRHACLALHSSAGKLREVVVQLDRLLLAFGFWQAVFTSGEVRHNAQTGGRPRSSLVQGASSTDATHWLFGLVHWFTSLIQTMFEDLGLVKNSRCTQLRS